MIRRVANALSLLLRVQWRSFFPHVYILLAVGTIVVFRYAIPASYWSWALPVVLFGEPAILGIMLVAAQSFFDRNERSVTALAVTPLRSGEYVVALVLTSSLLGLVYGLSVQVGVLGVDARLLWLSLPLFLATLVSGFVGLFVSTYFREFTSFLIGGGVPATLVIQLPILCYFDLLPRFGLVWIPSHPALFAIDGAVNSVPSLSLYALCCALLAVYAGGAFLVAQRAFDQRVIGRLESL